MKESDDGWHFYKIPEAWLNFSWDLPHMDWLDRDDYIELTQGKDGVWHYAPKVLND